MNRKICMSTNVHKNVRMIFLNKPIKTLTVPSQNGTSMLQNEKYLCKTTSSNWKKFLSVLSSVTKYLIKKEMHHWCLASFSLKLTMFINIIDLNKLNRKKNRCYKIRWNPLHSLLLDAQTNERSHINWFDWTNSHLFQRQIK